MLIDEISKIDFRLPEARLLSLNGVRRGMEDGITEEWELTFLKAIEEFKRQNKIAFLRNSHYLRIFVTLMRNGWKFGDFEVPKEVTEDPITKAPKLWRKWAPVEDRVLIKQGIIEASKLLKRTRNSCKMRLRQLKMRK